MPTLQATKPAALSLPASMHLASMTVCVADESHLPADYIEWRDIFCASCGMSECMKGTAEDLARHVLSLDWMVMDVKAGDAMCSPCAEKWS